MIRPIIDGWKRFWALSWWWKGSAAGGAAAVLVAVAVGVVLATGAGDNTAVSGVVRGPTPTATAEPTSTPTLKPTPSPTPAPTVEPILKEVAAAPWIPSSSMTCLQALDEIDAAWEREDAAWTALWDEFDRLYWAPRVSDGERDAEYAAYEQRVAAVWAEYDALPEVTTENPDEFLSVAEFAALYDTYLERERALWAEYDAMGYYALSNDEQDALREQYAQKQNDLWAKVDAETEPLFDVCWAEMVQYNRQHGFPDGYWGTGGNICADGWVSPSPGRPGRCSWHGGVAR